jgi:hypothetical protein
MKILNLTLVFLFCFSLSYSQSYGEEVLGHFLYNSYTDEIQEVSIETKIILVKNKDNSIKLVMQHKGASDSKVFDLPGLLSEVTFLDKKMYYSKLNSSTAVTFDASEFFIYSGSAKDTDKMVLLYLSKESIPKSYSYANRKLFIEFFVK